MTCIRTGLVPAERLLRVEPEAEPAPVGRPSEGRLIQVRIPPEDVEAVDARAESAGITRPEWIRRAIRTALR